MQTSPTPTTANTAIGWGAVATQDAEVLQVNHYYPFGMLMGESSGGDVQPWKYGGKELTREAGIDLCDFEARAFDNLRFTSPDPLAESYYATSPYAYCLNTPLRNIDPTGMWTLASNKSAKDSKVLCILPQNYKTDAALNTDYKRALQANVQILIVDNTEDLFDGLKSTNIHSTVNTITLNSHGNPGTFSIGNDEISMASTFTDFSEYFSGKNVFIGACNTGKGIPGKTLTEYFAKEAKCTVISAEQRVRSGYRYDGSESLAYTDKPSYVVSVSGNDAKVVYGVTISKHNGIKWRTTKTNPKVTKSKNKRRK